MRIAIVGAGSIGGYFGGRLAAAGHEVVFLDHGPTLEALQTQGLVINSPRGDLNLRVHATSDGAGLPPVDLVILSVKTYHTQAIQDLVKALAGPSTAVMSLQNGLLAEGVLPAMFGPERVIGALARISVVTIAPGVIQHRSRLERVELGELDGRVTERARQIHAALESSGVEAVLAEDIHRGLWAKFLELATTAGVCCLSRAPLGEVLGCAPTRELVRRGLREVLQLAARRGVYLGDEELTLDSTMAFLDRLDGQIKPSMLVDLEAGRPLEVEALSGAVVTIGRDCDLELPVHEVIYAALLPAHHRALKAMETAA